MYTGRTQRDKDRLAEAITEDAVNILKVEIKDVIVVFQEIPLENHKENVKSETKPPKVKTLSEEEPSFTTVSKEELSERSAEVQQDNATEN